MTSPPPGAGAALAVTPAGHPPEVWAPRLAAAPRIALTQLAPLLARGPRAHLVVAGAHPDDETLGSGRLISEWSAAGGMVHAVLASDGEACLDQVTSRPPELATVRLAEWHAALDALHLRGQRRTLHLPDGELTAYEQVIAAALEDLLDTLAPHPVVLAAPWRADPHPDHRAVGRAAARITARVAAGSESGAGPGAATAPSCRWEYPVWMTYWSDPAETGPTGTGPTESGPTGTGPTESGPTGTGTTESELIVMEHAPGAEADFRAAVDCFGSQLRPWRPGLGAVVPAEMVAHQKRQLLFVPWPCREPSDQRRRNEPEETP